MGVFEGSGKIRIRDGGGIEYSTDNGATWTAITGGSGVPGGARVTAAADRGDLTFPGLAGGQEIFFEWLAGTAGDTNLILQLNGVVTGYTTNGIYNGNAPAGDASGGAGLGTGVATTTGFDVARAGGSSARDRVKGHIVIWPDSTDGHTLVVMESTAYSSTGDAEFETFNTYGIFPSSTITSAALVPLNGSSTGIKQSSTGVSRTLGLTA